jgi:23S rRNA pseudouridine1911/1915/1917 synthase
MEQPLVVYEDRNIVGLNKPAGWLVYADGRSGSPAVADWAAKRWPEMQGVGESSRPGIVHRLDKETSGLLLLAKNQAAFEWLKQQFQNRLIKKEYRALVHGAVKNNQGEIDLPISRHRANRAGLPVKPVA